MQACLYSLDNITAVVCIVGVVYILGVFCMRFGFLFVVICLCFWCVFDVFCVIYINMGSML